MTGIRPSRRSRQDVIDEAQQMVEIPHCRVLIGRIVQIRLRVGDLFQRQPYISGGEYWSGLETHLLKHIGEQHVKPCISFYRLLKLLHLWPQLFRVGVYMLNRVVKEFMVMPFILRQPIASLSLISRWPSYALQ